MPYNDLIILDEKGFWDARSYLNYKKRHHNYVGASKC